MAITAGKKPLSSLGVKAEGDYKLVVTLDRRIPYFKIRMARREEGKFDVMVSTWIADFNDAISFLDLLTSNNSRNYGEQ
ncbi:hypothetical protein LDBUL1632_00166 [Lactobacillus delbrueckii subsp. bulgaricus CNCM I-1632]